jgi:lipopolysaccharide/colanic/teichoic acid biosynthesis glycosyltransferase
MWKFRTMVPNAETLGPELTTAGDRRITPLGARLRARKLDELPQLFNVLVGDMSMVGPRPEVSKFVGTYTHDQRRVLELKPGVTDRASILFADEAALLAGQADPERFYVEQILPEKIRINLEYARKSTPLSDLAVVFETAGRVLLLRPTKSGAQRQMPFHISPRSATETSLNLQ